MINRDWKALARQGHPDCPKDCVYVGMGASGTGLPFGLELKSRGECGGGSMTPGWSGANTNWHYFCPIDVWQRKTGLNYEKVMNTPNDKKEITLSEIKAKFEEAKKLIGKKVRYGFDSTSQNTSKVEKVELAVSEIPHGMASGFVIDAFNANGYSIILTLDSGWIDIRDIHEVISEKLTIK
jgi:hypothetical protein